MRRCIHTTTRRAFSLCYPEWHKKTASIHLNVGFYSYCWCPYPQDTRQCSGGLHFAGAWLDLFCTWVSNSLTWDIKHERVLFNSCTPPLGLPPCELISAIWSRWGHTFDPVLKAALHSLHMGLTSWCPVLLHLSIQALSVSSNATARAAAVSTGSHTGTDESSLNTISALTSTCVWAALSHWFSKFSNGSCAPCHICTFISKTMHTWRLKSDKHALKQNNVLFF